MINTLKMGHFAPVLKPLNLFISLYSTDLDLNTFVYSIQLLFHSEFSGPKLNKVFGLSALQHKTQLNCVEAVASFKLALKTLLFPLACP